MAVVTAQRPDSLSLSGNLKDFVLQNNAAVDFVLRTGSQTILEETYYPGNGNMIRIDLREIIEKHLSVSIPAGNSEVQTNAARSFTAEYDGTPYSFVAVLGGVDNLKDTPTNFLRNNFLTWQPQTKEVTYYSPEYITFYAPVACSLKLRAYFESRTETLTLYSASAGAVHTVNLQYAIVAAKFNNRYPGAYDIWTEDSSGKQMSYVQRYIATPARSRVESWYLFVNSLGGIDCMRAYGSDSYEPSYEHNIAEINGESVEYRVDTDRLHTRNTGRLTKDESAWLQDFFVARQKYHHTPTGLRQIVVTESDPGISTSDVPGSYSFTYKYASETPYLNLTRVKLPTNLSVPAPKQDDLFFLPPRLAEFPKHAIDRDLLLPANDPHDDTWSAIVVGEMYDSILNGLIRQLEGIDMNPRQGGGGSGDIYIIKLNDLTPPTDENVFSSLRTLYEIERSIDELDERFLRKDIDDTAHGVISFDREIRSTYFIDGFDGGLGWMITEGGNAWLDFIRVRTYGIIGRGLGSEMFISGFPNGIGWDLSSYKRINAAEVEETKWRLEIDDVIVRGKLRVFEFVVSQLRGENDNVIFAGMMKVDHYDPETERLYLQTDEGVLYNPFRAGDILMMQRFGGMPSAGNAYNVIKQYELRVTEAFIGDMTAGKDRLDYITFSNFVGELSEIAEGDVLTRVDSVSDSTRKGVVKITTIDEIGAPYIDVVYGMKTDPMNSIKARLGNLTGIRTKNNIVLEGLWGLYAEGAILENSQIFLDNGMTIEQNFTVMNGQFSSEINAVKDQIAQEKGNILRNPLFSENLYYWDIVSDISVFRANVGLLWLNREFYANKRKAAEIYRDGSRYVLRLKETKIYQQNQYFQFQEGTEKEGAYSFSFFYRALKAGKLKAGITGTELYTEINITPEDSYTKFSIIGEWDGIGDFVFETNGEILIYSASLFNDAFANAVVKLQTQITQNEEEIALRATKQYVDAQDGSILIEMEGRFSVTAESISAVVRRTNNIENTIATAGWITTADGNYLYASKKLENGDVIASYINQTANSVKIAASKVDLVGQVTFNMFDTSTKNTIEGKLDGSYTIENGKLNAAIAGTTIISGGYIRAEIIDTYSIYANQAFIGNFTIESGWLKANSNTGKDVGYIDMRSSNTRVAFGRDLIPASAGGGATCTAIISNRNAADDWLGETIALSLQATGGRYSTALTTIGGARIMGRVSTIEEVYLNIGASNPTGSSAANLKLGRWFVVRPTIRTAMYLPSDSAIHNQFGYYPSGNAVADSSCITINILVSAYATDEMDIVSPVIPIFDRNGNTLYENRAFSASNFHMAKGNIISLTYYDRAWYISSSNFK